MQWCDLTLALNNTAGSRNFPLNFAGKSFEFGFESADIFELTFRVRIRVLMMKKILTQNIVLLFL
jgi:hypothetical protein